LTVFEEQEQNPIANFMCALKAPETRRQWPHKKRIYSLFMYACIYMMKT